MKRYILIGFLGFAVIFFGFYFIKKHLENKVIEEQATILLERINNISKLMVVEGHFNEVYNYKQAENIFFNLIPVEKKMILVVKDKAYVGYDLEKMDIKLDKKNKKIVQTNYKKEKEKDLEIKKLKERLASHSYRAIEEIALKDPEESYTTTTSKSLALFDKFEYILAKEQLYLNPELDQNLVVKILATNKKYLYDAISEHSDLNFRGIINRMRINEAKKHMAGKLKNNDTINFSTIYAECGFNSNSSFYRAFKLITGITPNDYATELNRELATVYKS
jgi:AraC-like DNA-binding protein